MSINLIAELSKMSMLVFYIVYFILSISICIYITFFLYLFELIFFNIHTFVSSFTLKSIQFTYYIKDIRLTIIKYILIFTVNYNYVFLKTKQFLFYNNNNNNSFIIYLLSNLSRANCCFIQIKSLLFERKWPSIKS